MNERSGATPETDIKGGASHEDQTALGDRGVEHGRVSRWLRQHGRRQRQLELTSRSRIRRGAAASGAPLLLRAYAVVVVIGLLALVVGGAVAGKWNHVGAGDALFWVLFCAVANLMSTPTTATHTYLSMSAPVNIAMGVVFPAPVVAALVAAGSVSHPEVTRTTTPLRAAFNRAQLGLSTAAAVSVLRAESHLTPEGVIGTVVVYHFVNWSLVGVAERTARGTPIRTVFSRLLPPGLLAAFTYLCMGALGVVFGLAYQRIGAWAVALLSIPLLGARQAVRATQAIERAERERRELADRLVDERERERLRIASDMHDVVLQDLAAIQRLADNVTFAAGERRDRVGSLASGVRDAVDKTVADVRRVIADLRHVGVDADGVVPTLRRYVTEWSHQTGLPVGLEIHGEASTTLPTPVALVVYECCQEALTNVVRHARANHVDVVLTIGADEVELRVTDDGIGLDMGHVASGSGMGLRLTREKLALAGGAVWVHSPGGRGTELVARVPLATVAHGE